MDFKVRKATVADRVEIFDLIDLFDRQKALRPSEEAVRLAEVNSCYRVSLMTDHRVRNHLDFTNQLALQSPRSGSSCVLISRQLLTVRCWHEAETQEL